MVSFHLHCATAISKFKTINMGRCLLESISSNNQSYFTLFHVLEIKLLQKINLIKLHKVKLNNNNLTIIFKG